MENKKIKWYNMEKMKKIWNKAEIKAITKNMKIKKGTTWSRSSRKIKVAMIRKIQTFKIIKRKQLN